ncbi:MAG: hypothetical protein RL110_1402 [Bacteroidota bacterium]|jgi:L-alanine-DL-glutamate epimerase-like enolase superfamily enzyme
MRQSLTFAKLEIPFKVSFNHHSAKRAATQAVIVCAESGGHKGFGEGCPREYVTNESMQSAEIFFRKLQHELQTELDDLPSLYAFRQKHAGLIRTNHAAWCAIEMALLDLWAQLDGKSIEAFLGLPALTTSFHYTGVIGQGNAAYFEPIASRHLDLGFTEFKLKINGDPAIDFPKLQYLMQQQEGLRIRLDANNLWKSPKDVAAYCALLPMEVQGLEEPLQSKRIEDLSLVHQKTGIPVVLDESFCALDQLAGIAEHSSSFIINLRVSKVGGLLNGFEVVKTAKSLGIRVIVGAQVGETSLLTRAALPLAQALEDQLVAMEGGYGTLLLESDLVEKPLMFGQNGQLHPQDMLQTDAFGWQLPLSEELLERYVRHVP